MSKAVLLFSGQGAQKVGMGQDLVEAYPSAKALFEKADSVLSRSLTKVMFNGPTAVSYTHLTLPTILLV